MEEKDIARQLKIQRTIIISLIIFIIIGGIVGGTFAWYTRRATETANIVFSDPVEVYITGLDGTISSEIVPNTGKILPGSKVQVKAGFQLGKQDNASSDAYVRVRLSITCDDVLGEDGKPLEEDLIKEGIINPYSDVWKKVNFKKEDGSDDYWWVLCVKENSQVGSARIVKNMESELFYDGIIVINENLQNEYANADIKVFFEVEAIQSANIENPLLDENNPTWGKLDETA